MANVDPTTFAGGSSSHSTAYPLLVPLTPMTHIFTVDDDQGMRRLLRAGLEKLGHQVSEAGLGAEALELVCRSPPDVVLLDFENFKRN